METTTQTLKLQPENVKFVEGRHSKSLSGTITFNGKNFQFNFYLNHRYKGSDPITHDSIYEDKLEEQVGFIRTFKKHTGLMLKKETKYHVDTYSRRGGRSTPYDVFSYETEKKDPIHFSFTTSECPVIYNEKDERVEVKDYVHFNLRATINYEKLNQILEILKTK